VAESSAQMPGLKHPLQVIPFVMVWVCLVLFGCLCCQTGKISIETKEAWQIDTGHRPTPRSLVLLRFSAKLAKRAVEAAPRRLLGSCRSHPN